MSLRRGRVLDDVWRSMRLTPGRSVPVSTGWDGGNCGRDAGGAFPGVSSFWAEQCLGGGVPRPAPSLERRAPGARIHDGPRQRSSIKSLWVAGAQ